MGKEYIEKFVAYIDILGFKNMVLSSTTTGKPSIEELMKLQDILKNEKMQNFYKKSGPEIAPCSNHIQKDMNFVVTQVSDCVIASAEISPAGVINLINFCWQIVLMLLEEGVLCRGYITKGKMYHVEDNFIGQAYDEAVVKQDKVAFMKGKDETKATPFVEVDKTVFEYVNSETDATVREMFERFTKTEGDLTAIFPFQLMYSQDIMSASAKKSNNNMRKRILFYKEKILENAKNADEAAMQKVNHYIRALDKQLEICDAGDTLIDKLNMPFGEIFNG